MKIIIKETGEKKEVLFMDKNGFDWSEDTAASNGFDMSQFPHDDEEDAFIMPKYEADYWVDFFETMNFCEDELNNLRNRYDADEVNSVLWDEMPEFDIDVYKEAVKNTAAILQRRYDIEAAQLVASYDSNLDESSFHYFKESLYRRDDGSYFLAGEGGPMTKYLRLDASGAQAYGERSFSITAAQAQAWLAKYHGEEGHTD